MTRTSPIGVIDSGVGGLTTVREALKLLHGENIVYCGDNANAPYGNRSEDEIVALTKAMLTFLKGKGVKLVAVACNTISSTFESPTHGGYQDQFGFPVFSIVRSAAEDVVRRGYADVGVIATVATIRSNAYNELIDKLDPSIRVHGEPSKNLAALIEKGHLDSDEIRNEVRSHVSNLMNQFALKEIVLGCTHYPIVQRLFEAAAPGVTFINPARDQALTVKKYLKEHDLLNHEKVGTLEINTSGSKDIYDSVLAELEITREHVTNIVKF